MRDFLHRDLSERGVNIPAVTLSRFWNMVAHFHGGLWNAADFARSLGSSENTARRYLDVLSGAWAVRQPQPWFENTGKRQVKAPKVYIQDSGLLHALLDLSTGRSVVHLGLERADWEAEVSDRGHHSLARAIASGRRALVQLVRPKVHLWGRIHS